MQTGHRGENADEPYFKLSRRLFRSSVWEEDPATRIVWITLLHLAQLPENRKHGPGAVIITRGNLCREAFVRSEELDHALARLTTPDPTSRTDPGHGRLEVLPNGYRIRAFDAYHDTEEYEARRAKRVAAGKARAARGARDRGRFTSTPPAHAGEEPAQCWTPTSSTRTRTSTKNDGSSIPVSVQTTALVNPRNNVPAKPSDATAPASVAVAPVTRVLEAEILTWSRDACDIWIKRFGGIAPGGIIGKSLKPLVDRYGWEQSVRKAWIRYLAQAEAQYASAPRFAQTFGRWAGLAPDPPPRDDVLAHNDRVMAEALRQARAEDEIARGAAKLLPRMPSG